MVRKVTKPRKTQAKKPKAEKLCNWKECGKKGTRETCSAKHRTAVSRAAAKEEWSKIRRPEKFKERQKKVTS